MSYSLWATPQKDHHELRPPRSLKRGRDPVCTRVYIRPHEHLSPGRRHIVTLRKTATCTHSRSVVESIYTRSWGSKICFMRINILLQETEIVCVACVAAGCGSAAGCSVAQECLDCFMVTLAHHFVAKSAAFMKAANQGCKHVSVSWVSNYNRLTYICDMILSIISLDTCLLLYKSAHLIKVMGENSADPGQ